MQSAIQIESVHGQYEPKAAIRWQKYPVTADLTYVKASLNHY